MPAPPDTETSEFTHGAQFSEAVLDRIELVLRDHLPPMDPDRGEPDMRLVLDPFAGPGVRLARLMESLSRVGPPLYEFIGVEIEEEWAAVNPLVRHGDATKLTDMFEPDTFDVLVTSPCYGNRMADTYTDGGKTQRHTYTEWLQRKPSVASAGAMQWGPAYRLLHTTAYAAAHAVLRPGALVIVNMSNHYRTKRKGDPSAEQRVVEFHLNSWLMLGAYLVGVWPVETPRQGFGQNGELRCDYEYVMALRLPPTKGML